MIGRDREHEARERRDAMGRTGQWFNRWAMLIALLALLVGSAAVRTGYWIAREAVRKPLDASCIRIVKLIETQAALLARAAEGPLPREFYVAASRHMIDGALDYDEPTIVAVVGPDGDDPPLLLRPRLGPQDEAEVVGAFFTPRLREQIVQRASEGRSWVGEAWFGPGEAGVMAVAWSEPLEGVVVCVVSPPVLAGMLRDRVVGWTAGMAGVVLLLFPCSVGLISLSYRAARRRIVEQAEEVIAGERRYRQIFDGNPAVKLLVEPGSGAILDANRAACAFYGLDHAAMTRTTLRELAGGGRGQGEAVKASSRQDIEPSGQSDVQESGIAPSPAQGSPSPLQPALAPRPLAGSLSSNGATTIQVSQRAADGQVRLVEMDFGPVNVDGHDALFAVVHDVTERERLQREVLEISERERRSIGQDLHDGLGQQLAGIALMVRDLQEELERAGATDWPDGADRLGATDLSPSRRSAAPSRSAAVVEARRLAELVNDTIVQVGRSARGLHPIEPGPEGLALALENLTRQVSDLFGVHCKFESDEEALIEDISVATHLYRITQEATTNAIRHGRAGRIVVSLRRKGAALVLEIRDDGCGFPEDGPPPGTMGLRIMEYRATMIGGSLTVGRGPEGAGVAVRCVVGVGGEAADSR